MRNLLVLSITWELSDWDPKNLLCGFRVMLQQLGSGTICCASRLNQSSCDTARTESSLVKYVICSNIIWKARVSGVIGLNFKKSWFSNFWRVELLFVQGHCGGKSVQAWRLASQFAFPKMEVSSDSGSHLISLLHKLLTNKIWNSVGATAQTQCICDESALRLFEVGFNALLSAFPLMAYILILSWATVEARASHRIPK